MNPLDNGASAARIPTPSPGQWWRGSLHVHTLWSDGDGFPEMVAAWHKRRGYHFVALTDHNTIGQGTRWVDVAESRGGEAAFGAYRAAFGDWVEAREQDGRRLVRVKPLSEVRHLVEEPGRFLLLQGEEVSDRYGDVPLHVQALNAAARIAPQRGHSIVQVLQRTVDAILAQRADTGRLVVPQINHPNYEWAIAAEELLRVQGIALLEIHNGHPAVRNYGDATHASVERVWDILLAHRLAQPGGQPIFGTAVDDSHHHHGFGPQRANPGRAWVMVRAPRLTPESILGALTAGDFYATTGVLLDDIEHSGHRLRLRIRPAKGFPHVTEFIGTRRGASLVGQPVAGPDGRAQRVTRRYSDAIGHVLAEARGPSPTYTFTGDELYVRARVISARPKDNPFEPGDVEVAWTQPFLPGP